MRNIYSCFWITLLLLLLALPSKAQHTSSCLDSLQRIEKQLEQAGQQLLVQRDSIYQIIAKCKTDQERLPQLDALNKNEKEAGQNAKRIDKVQHEMEVERARLEHIERDAKLAAKQAKVQAISPVPLKGELNGHSWVDLGLPSGTKWATYNVGTKEIHGVGTRIAWGEIATKKTFSPSAYSLNNVELPSYAGDAKYDLATAKWGEGWYTPTKEQWDELIEYCDWDYVMINGINGVIFTSKKTYNYIFLPSTGYTDDETYKLKYTTYNLAYWSCTTQRNNGAFAYMANYEQGYVTSTNRYIAHCVRAVCGVSSETANAVQTAIEVVQTISDVDQGTTSTVQESTSKDKKKKKVTVQDVTNTITNTTEKAKKVKNTIQKTTKTINAIKGLFGR
jgi:hypothetical protein